MTILSRGVWRLAALQRQALENDTVPSALLLEAIEAYIGLKDCVDAEAQRSAQRERFEHLMLGTWCSSWKVPMTMVRAFGSAYAWPGDPDDVAAIIQYAGFRCSLLQKASKDGSYPETVVVVAPTSDDVKAECERLPSSSCSLCHGTRILPNFGDAPGGSRCACGRPSVHEGSKCIVEHGPVPCPRCCQDAELLHEWQGCTMLPTERCPEGECAQCGNAVGPP